MSDVETTLRGPEAYKIAARAVELMERHQVWPTALNFELWTHYVADPDGALARELTRLISLGEPMTELVSEELAAAYLPKARLNEQIRDAGDLLSKELEAVAKAIQNAQKSNAAFGKELAGASKSLDKSTDVEAIKIVVDNLAEATRRVHKENQSLETRLADSTAEVERLREHLEQVRRDATTDGLTNLANRKAFDEELDRACADADDSGTTLCLAVLDIDHFKGFNDTWGHQTGDQVIRYVASVIGRVAAPPRFAARYGGEEFAMIFPREASAIVATTLEEIRVEVSSRMLKRRSTNEDLGAITISSGFAERRPNETGHSIMERADAALYASKRGGRNRVTAAEAMPASANAA
ncbi:GGDEF domain-containing protein [Caulobacter sp. RL271]|jgi:diguanylate cyclase|uniref:diguanylate cyclase n=1 Tax=Caulobacter segnis TaxID=88688 RepID=A0ABY4ZM84_9CAUL|nr:GGDEF domain-containing protein [Caulobacter segnis]USQ93686.1 GGDEF domain-containing protein [Caulobacter segnis]